jgi:hypothetical protein
MQNSVGLHVALDVELDPEVAPRQARWLVHDVLAGTVTAPFLSDVLLATSELVTNALQFAPGPYRLMMQRDEASKRIRIGVTDASMTVPRRADGDILDPNAGRGLRIVDMVASEWGVALRDDGKEVWFEMVPGHHS